jgi:hypothetical protein
MAPHSLTDQQLVTLLREVAANPRAFRPLERTEILVEGIRRAKEVK